MVERVIFERQNGLGSSFGGEGGVTGQILYLEARWASYAAVNLHLRHREAS